MIPPETQYTKVDDDWIGYQVLGDGPIDVVFISGVASNIETIWDWPTYSRAFERIASYSRLIMFDPRGSGISDPIRFGTTHTWESLAEDVRAVLAAAKSERCAIFAQYDGGLAAILFAATYPDSTSALVLWNSYAKSSRTDDYPIGLPPEADWSRSGLADELWGRTAIIPLIDPSRADDPEYIRCAARFMRTANSPGRANGHMVYTRDIDARPVLASVRVPTLVLHSHNAFIPVDLGRYLADHITGARIVEATGADLNFTAEHFDFAMDETEEFLTGSRRAVVADRPLATVLFTDIVGSTEKASALGDRKWKELLALHDRLSGDEVERFRGRIVTTTGDGILATFDGPGRAIRCAHALGRVLERSDVPIRAGLHTGEVELREGDDIGGIAVHIASRVMSEAGPGEVVCSRTVKDLVAGSEFAFEDRGLCTLKGVPDRWQLYAVRQA